MAFISISKCFNISPHLRWFMAFIRGHERLAFLWFRDLISAWHIQRLNRVLRSHFLRTPSAHPGLVIWASILQDMLYSLSRWLRGIFAPKVIDKVAEMKIFRRRVVTSCSTVHVRHFRSFLPLGTFWESLWKRDGQRKTQLSSWEIALFRTPFHLVCWRSQKHFCRMWDFNPI